MIILQYLHKQAGAIVKKNDEFQQNTLRPLENHGQIMPNHGMGEILTKMTISKLGTSHAWLRKSAGRS